MTMERLTPVEQEAHDLYAYIQSMSPARQAALLHKLFKPPKQPTRLGSPHVLRSRTLVDQCSIDLDFHRVAKELGYTSAKTVVRLLTKNKDLYMELRRRVDQAEAYAELKAEYVRDYVRSILDFCPTDYFMPCPEGGWMLPEDKWGELPVHVKRLIESIEVKTIRGVGTFFSVKFVSKSSALSLAVRLVSLDKALQHTSPNGTIPWSEIADRQRPPEDSVERRLEVMLEHRVKEGPPPSQNGVH